jgi:hypothetical protein
MFIMLPVREGTPRVPPTCIIKTDFTYLGTITAVVPNVAFAHALFAFTVVVTFVFTGGVLAETSGPARVTRTLPRHTDTVFGTVLWTKAENQ